MYHITRSLNERAIWIKNDESARDLRYRIRMPIYHPTEACKKKEPPTAVCHTTLYHQFPKIAFWRRHDRHTSVLRMHHLRWRKHKGFIFSLFHTFMLVLWRWARYWLRDVENGVWGKCCFFAGRSETLICVRARSMHIEHLNVTLVRTKHKSCQSVKQINAKSEEKSDEKSPHEQRHNWEHMSRVFVVGFQILTICIHRACHRTWRREFRSLSHRFYISGISRMINTTTPGPTRIGTSLSVWTVWCWLCKYFWKALIFETN